MSELLKEASTLGSLRHPNIVWVYGVVLPVAVQQRVHNRATRCEPQRLADENFVLMCMKQLCVRTVDYRGDND